MAKYSIETANDMFEKEVKNLLSGYLGAKDTIEYLALKIKNIHRTYLEEVLAANE